MSENKQDKTKLTRVQAAKQRQDMQVLDAFAKEVAARQDEADAIKRASHGVTGHLPLFAVDDHIDADMPVTEDDGSELDLFAEESHEITSEHTDSISDTQYLNQIVNKVEKDDSIMQSEAPKTQEEIDAIVREVLAKMEAEHTIPEPADAVKPENKETIDKADEPLSTNEPVEQGKRRKKKKKSSDKGLYELDKPSKKYYAGITFFTICNICALICFFIAYGPFNYLRDMFVTTAMRTMTHKYLANVLYSTDTIQEILANNVTIEPDEVMDANAIKISGIKEEQTVFSSVYEEQVLKRDEGNDLYKVVRLNEDGYKGYITFVYDPTKIELAVTRYLGTIGEYVTTMAKLNKAHVAINGGGFIDYGGNGSGGQPTGYVIKNGKIVWTRQRGSSWGGGTIGFNQEGILILTKKQGKAALKEGIYNGVDFGPFLIVNGKSAEVSGNGGWGVHPRTIIGQRKDGIVVFLTIDGRSATSLGVDLNTCIKILERYDVYNAANLDGGASTVLAVEGKLMNKPVAYTKTGEREVPTAWIVVD